MIKSFAQKTILLFGILLTASLLFACREKEKQPDGPAGKPTQEISLTPGVPGGQPTGEVTPTQSGGSVSDITAVVTDDPVPTLMENDDADTDDRDSVRPGELDDTDDEPDDDPDDMDEQDDGRDDADDDSTVADNAASREADWQETFLFRIPEFTEGIYDGYTVEETFDRAHFLGVAKSEVLNYIDGLAQAGFTHRVETAEHDRRIIYTAANEENWIVELDYAEGQLSLGSGYREEDKTTPEYLAKIWSSTSLIHIPVFEAGKLGSNYAGSGGSYTAVFEEVSPDAVREYIILIKDAGFDVDPDAGDSDGFIWYSAEDENEIFCEITFYDGVLRINCGD